MVFFKWYGVNVNVFLHVPEFHQDWRYVQTIGVSVFNKKVSTSQHFGFLRATLRVLYNLNDVTERSACIVVGDKTNFWCENKLFVFDDTLMHQSFNQTDQTRYCLFVDIVRPTPFPRLLASVIRLTGTLSRSFSHIFYRNWKVLER
jgi:beta-hydroxylase